MNQNLKNKKALCDFENIESKVYDVINTPEWDKFIKPIDLINILKKNNLRLDQIDGMKFDLVTDKWSISRDKSVNYIAKFIKN